MTETTHAAAGSTLVGLRDLNHRTSAVMKLVREGATVVVTDHGHPVARIVPIASGPFEQLIAEGEYVRASGSAILAPPRTEATARPSVEVLDELRGERA